MRVILRRPQTYEFRNKFKGVPIPGLVFMDAPGTGKEPFAFQTKDSAEGLIEMMKRSAK